jgi:alpha-glucosidase
VQAGILMPRFSIHSWNDDGTANEPWMYPEVTFQVRELIELRRWLTPYLYLLLWRYHTSYEPVIRPAFYDFPDDPRCYAENDDLMLGPSLLAAAVVEPGAAARSVYLPLGAAWFDVWSGARFEGGQTVELPAPWNRPVLLAREGSAIPIDAGGHRGFLLFPPPEGECCGQSHEDDGETEAWRDGEFGSWRVGVVSEPGAMRVTVSRAGRFTGDGDEVELILPGTELRPVSLSGALLVREHHAGGQRHLMVKVVPGG